MTSNTFDTPEPIKHFQSICDSCQSLISSYSSHSEVRSYAEGYLDALRKCNQFDQRDQAKLETLVRNWLRDPSSFVGPDGDLSNLYYRKSN